jgi:hypothetical protein
VIIAFSDVLASDGLLARAVNESTVEVVVGAQGFGGEGHDNRAQARQSREINTKLNRVVVGSGSSFLSQHVSKQNQKGDMDVWCMQ